MKQWERDECANGRWHPTDTLSFNDQPLDLCMDNMGFVSQHEYRYAAGFGDSLTIEVPHVDSLNLKPCYWRKGTAYNYGIGKPNYPVPALADTKTTCFLGQYQSDRKRSELAWDGIYIDMSDHPGLPLSWYFPGIF